MRYVEVYSKCIKPVKYAASEEEKTFLHPIAADLKDTNHAGIYADWLEDHNRPAMAKVVRLGSINPHGLSYSGSRKIWDDYDWDKIPENGHYHILDVAKDQDPELTDSIAVEIPHPSDSAKRLAFSARVPTHESASLIHDLEAEGFPLEPGFQSDKDEILKRHERSTSTNKGN